MSGLSVSVGVHLHGDTRMGVGVAAEQGRAWVSLGGVGVTGATLFGSGVELARLRDAVSAAIAELTAGDTGGVR